MADRYGERERSRPWEERERRSPEWRDWESRRSPGGGYYPGPSGAGHDPRRPERGSEERGFFDRAGDEVRSWFGDEGADRRRSEDDRRSGEDDWRRGGRSWPSWESREREAGYGREREAGYGRNPDEERQWARQWGYVEPGETQGGGWRERRRERDWEGSSRERPFGGATGWLYTETWIVPGPFAGRGPRGYQRSDERIREDVSERLAQHGQLDASDVEVQVVGGEVTLTGSVPSRHAKRLAEDVAECVFGVREVHNQLRARQGLFDQGSDEPSGRRAA